MRSILISLSVSVSLMLAGCGTTPEERLEAPTSKVEHFSATPDASVLTLRFSNPNIVPLVVNSSAHTLTLGDKSMGVIDDAEPIGLPPRGFAVHTVKLTVKVAQAAQAYLLNHPGEVRVTVKSALSAVTTADDTITLTSIGSTLIKTP